MANASQKTSNFKGDHLSIRMFGGLGDGSKDESSALQAGINYISLHGGGWLLIPPGIWPVKNITLRQNVWIRGAGYGVTELVMPNSANTWMFKSDGYDALYATIAAHTDPTPPSPGSPPDLSMGIWAFGLESLSLNGNKANNASGNGLSIYGYNFILKHLRIFDFAGDGMTTAWSNAASFPDWTDAMEARFYDVKVHNNGNNGWNFHGPHDSRTSMCETYENTLVGFYLGRNGASYLDGLHSYGPTQQIAFRNDELCHLTDCVFETAQLSQIVANNAILGTAKIFSVSSISTSKGLILGSVLDPTPKNISNITGGTGVVLTVTFTGAHGLFSGDQVAITGVVGMPLANFSPWVVTKVNSTQVTLNFSETVTGAYVSGGSALLMGIPNGMQLVLNISNCAGGLIDTTYAYGSGNSLYARGFFTPDFTNPYVFVGGTNTANYAAALALLNNWDYDVWINADSTKPLGNLHYRNTQGVTGRRFDIEGPESTEIGLHIRGTVAASSTHPYGAFTRNANNTSFQIYTDDGTSLLNFFEADYAALQCILYRDTLIKATKKFIFENTGAIADSAGPDPNGSYTAPPGSIYLRSSGELWVKESGSGNTGWKKLGKLPINLTSSTDVDVSGLTDQQPVIRNGSVLASAAGIDKTSSFTTGVTFTTQTKTISGTTFTYVDSVGSTQETFISTKGVRTT